MTQPHNIDRACQKCGGEIQGWTCQGCGQVFRENGVGVLVFAPMEAAAWRFEEWGHAHQDWLLRLTHDRPVENKRTRNIEALAVIPTETPAPSGEGQS